MTAKQKGGVGAALLFMSAGFFLAVTIAKWDTPVEMVFWGLGGLLGLMGIVFGVHAMFFSSR
ncbi:MAG: hypothetical protein ACYTGZ_17300 [Planctomycetota bacterium]